MDASAEADAVAEFTLVLLARQGDLEEMPDVRWLADGPASVAVRSILGPSAVKRFRDVVVRQSSTRAKISHKPTESSTHVVASNYSGLLLEALQAVATPEISRTMVRGALKGGGLAEVPGDIEDFARFAKYAVFDEVMGRLGADEAGAVMERLQPIIERARLDSGVLRRGGSAEPIREESDAPQVLLVGGGLRMTAFIQWLEAAGCEVAQVHGAPGAVAHCGKQLPHVVICDVGLAGVGGVHLAALLRRLYRENTPPMLIVGASAQHEDGDYCIAVPPDVQRDGLLDALDYVLAMYEVEPED